VEEAEGGRRPGQRPEIPPKIMIIIIILYNYIMRLYLKKITNSEK
jgi:hypothetical protein